MTMDIYNPLMLAQRVLMVKAIRDHRAKAGPDADTVYMMGVIWGCIDYMNQERGRRYTYTVIQGFADGIVDKIIEEDQP